MPMLNLHKLDRLLKNYSKKDGSIDESRIPWYEWNSRREWFGINYKYFYNWLHYFDFDNKSKQNKYEKLYNFLVDGIKYGPTMPHFYDEKGNLAFKIDKNDAINFAFAPYFYQDYGALWTNEKVSTFIKNTLIEEEEEEFEVKEALSTNPFPQIPFVYSNNKKYFLYNPITNEYEAVTTKNFDPKEFTFKDNVALPKDLELDVWITQRYQNLHQLGTVQMYGEEYFGKKIMGFDEICVLLKMPLGISLPKNKAHGEGFGVDLTVQKPSDTSTFGPYEMGLCKLMLLRMGVNEKNEDIKDQDSLYPVYQQLKTLSNQDRKNHAWSDEYFNKEKFLIYQVAKIFKNNKTLFDKVQQYIDFSPLKRLKAYQNLKNKIEKNQLYRNSDGTTLYDSKKASPYFLGEEQALAYFTCYVIRTLWYGALNIDAFEEETAELIDDFNEYFNNAANFLNVWEQIIEKLPKKRKNYFSFEGHGWVVCFDENIIDFQKEELNNKQKAVIEKIKCVGIESMFSKELPAFYKRTRNEIAWKSLHDDRKLIALPKEFSRQLRGFIHMKDKPKGALTLKEYAKINLDIINFNEKNKKGEALSSDEKEKLKDHLEAFKKQKELADNILTEKATLIQKFWKKPKEERVKLKEKPINKLQKSLTTLKEKLFNLAGSLAKTR